MECKKNMIIRSPSRLHMTLIDLSGAYERIDGGMGLTLQDPNFILLGETTEKKTQIEFSQSIMDICKKECIEKIQDATFKIKKYFNIDEDFYFKVKNAYTPHSGLGSGTQIALSTAKIITKIMGIEADAYKLAQIVGRGGTSGIGVSSFENGGLIIDGGHSLEEKSTFSPSSSSSANPPVLLANYEFPKDWKILIVLLNSDVCVNGNKEVNIFQKYCPIPKQEVCELSHTIFMNIIPFLIEHNIQAFGRGIDLIQNLGFKNIEVSLQSVKIKNLMNKLREIGAYGVGMSSFGPAVYSIYDKNNKNIVDEIRDYVGLDGTVLTTKAQNSGYELY